MPEDLVLRPAIRPVLRSAVRDTLTKGVGHVVTGVMGLGDSLTEHADSDNNYGYPVLLGTMSGKTTFNAGHSGAGLDEMDDNFASWVTANFVAGTHSDLVVMGGTNNVVGGDKELSRAEFWAHATSIAAKGRALGMKVWFMTQPPRLGGQQAALLEFISDLRADWATICDGLIDLDLLAPFLTNTYMLSDGLHLTKRAAWVVADNVRQALGLSLVVTDTTPNAFSFTDIPGATTSTDYTAEYVLLAGLTAPATFTVTGGVLMVNGANKGASGTLDSPYDYVTARQTSSATELVTTDAVVTIGGVSDTFSVTTASAGSTINWNTSTVGGTGTFSDTDHTFTGTSNNWCIKSTDSAISGKQLFAATYTTAGARMGLGLASGAQTGLWNNSLGAVVLKTNGLYSNSVNLSNFNVTTGATVGFVIDTVAKKLWVTVDGINFRDNVGTKTKAQVEAGTGGVDITTMVDDAGALYPYAEAVFGDASGTGAVITLLNAWPWSVPSGYTYVGAP